MFSDAGHVLGTVQAPEMHQLGLGKKSMLYEQQSALGKCRFLPQACIIFASGVDIRLAAIVN